MEAGRSFRLLSVAHWCSSCNRPAALAGEIPPPTRHSSPQPPPRDVSPSSPLMLVDAVEPPVREMEATVISANTALELSHPRTFIKLIACGVAEDYVGQKVVLGEWVKAESCYSPFELERERGQATLHLQHCFCFPTNSDGDKMKDYQ